MVDLSTRNRRKRLPPDDNPTYVRIGRGLSLGYRRRQAGGAGNWYARVYVGKANGSPYQVKVVGTADDLPHIPADGTSVLTYAQAVEAARVWDPDAPTDDIPGAPVTVGDVVARYLAWADEHRGRSAREARYAMEAHVLPKLADVEIERLTADRLRRWLVALAKKPARTRSPKGKQRYREAVTAEAKRARRSTANRVFSVLKAALNRAWKEGAIKGDPVWRRVESFRGVEESRSGYLEADQIQRLLNACAEADFRALVAGAICTGARYQELARLRVQDVNLDAGSLVIRQSKTNKPRAIYLGDEGRVLFDSLTAGREPGALVFSRAGKPWGKSEQQHRMRAACKAAGIEPNVTFHGLRHTYASLFLMNGGNPAALSKQLGHADSRMIERHYAHLADDWRKQQAVEFAPQLGVEPGNARRLARRQEAQSAR